MLLYSAEEGSGTLGVSNDRVDSPGVPGEDLTHDVT